MVVGVTSGMVAFGHTVPEWWQITFGGIVSAYFVGRQLTTRTTKPAIDLDTVDLLNKIRKGDA
jgi:hypothetical protein